MLRIWYLSYFCHCVVLSSILFQAVSAEEVRHAFLLACARDINEDKSPEVLKEWKAALLTTPFEFTVLAGEKARFEKNNNLREESGDQFNVQGRTVFQRTIQLNFFQRQFSSSGQLPPKELAIEFNKSINVSAMSEPVTQTFCDHANTVHNRGLKYKSVTMAIQDT